MTQATGGALAASLQRAAEAQAKVQEAAVQASQDVKAGRDGAADEADKEPAQPQEPEA